MAHNQQETKVGDRIYKNPYLPKNPPRDFQDDAPPIVPEKFSEVNLETESGPPRLAQDIIARRAYEIWEESGKIPGRELENWFQAESELRSKID